MFAQWENLGQVAYKPGVWGTPSDALQSAIDTAASIWEAIGSSLTVTSLQDGTHAAGPCGHSAGNAVDLRTNNLTPAQQQQAYSQLQQQLPGYRVIWETDHIHVQTTGALCSGGSTGAGSGRGDVTVTIDESTGLPIDSIVDPSAIGGASGFDLNAVLSSPLLWIGLALFLLVGRGR